MNTSHRSAKNLLSARPVTVVAAAAMAAALSLAACGPQSGAPVASNGTAVPLTAQQPDAQTGNANREPSNVSTVASPNASVMPGQPVPLNAAAIGNQPPQRYAVSPNDAQRQDEVAAPARAAEPSRPVASAHLGEVLAVEPIRNRPQGNGTGAVIGGVLGAVVGNQFGHGGGRAVTTVLGGVGGAVAGNNVERNHREGIVGYRVSVRLDNGASRTFQESNADEFRVGDRVRIDRGQLRPV